MGGSITEIRIMQFQRSGNIKESMEIGKWSDHIPIKYLTIIGTIGWFENTERVNYCFEGRDLKAYLQAVENSGYIRGKEADAVATEYMKSVFRGSNILEKGKSPAPKKLLRAAIWDILVTTDDREYLDAPLDTWRGKNLSYEGGIYTIPNDEI
jgi:hypothetical protein